MPGSNPNSSSNPANHVRIMPNGLELLLKLTKPVQIEREAPAGLGGPPVRGKERGKIEGPLGRCRHGVDRGRYLSARHHLRTAIAVFCLCQAWRKTKLCGPSRTSSATSAPRIAGKS
jgi:hypothetical protein